MHPTLNPQYNALLLRWAAAGSPSEPECEECGKDLAGQEVHETDTQWICTACHEQYEDESVFFTSDELDEEGNRCVVYNDDYPTRSRYNEDREDFHSDG